MSETPEQSAATTEANTATPVQQPANSAPASATPAQQPATPRQNAPENSAAQLLTQVHTAISALPEQIAKVLAEQNPRPVQQAAPAKTETKTETKTEKTEATKEPQKKTFTGWWFGQ